MIKVIMLSATLALAVTSGAHAVSQVDKAESNAGAKAIEQGLNTHAGKILKSGIKKALPHAIRRVGGGVIDVFTPNIAEAPTLPGGSYGGSGKSGGNPGGNNRAKQHPK